MCFCNMRKTAALLSACLLMCSLCACAQTESTTTEPAPDTTAAVLQTQTNESQSETAADPIETGEPTTDPASLPTLSASETQDAPQSTQGTQTTHNPDDEPALPAESVTAATSDAPSASSTRKTLIDQLRENIDSRKPLGLRKTDPAFFDDAVFVGDSVTMGLKNYVQAQRNNGNACLGSSQFLCCGSMGYTNTLGKVGSGSMHPTYKGNKVTVEDGIRQCGAGKALIMLGMNDFSAYGEKTWKSSVTTLLDRIEDANPRVDIYIQSVTPIMSGKEHGRFTNEEIREFNDYLQSVCTARGYTYIDIYSCLSDENGYLKSSYCGDASAMGIHMSTAGAAAWAQYLQETFCGTA